MSKVFRVKAPQKAFRINTPKNVRVNAIKKGVKRLKKFRVRHIFGGVKLPAKLPTSDVNQPLRNDMEKNVFYGRKGVALGISF